MDFNPWLGRKGPQGLHYPRGSAVAAWVNPRIVLGVFSQGASSVQGVYQETRETDCAKLCNVHALAKNPHHEPCRDRVRGPSRARVFGVAGGRGGGSRTPQALARTFRLASSG